MSAYCQVVLILPIVGLKYYKYEYTSENPDTYMETFEEMPAKEFKFKSAIRQCID
jgi:hypothetical protein